MTTCGCAHGLDLHATGGGPCLVELPEFPEDELPAWRCSCRRYSPAAPPAGPWRWHSTTASWTAVAS